MKYYKNLHSQTHEVSWEGDVVTCSCKNFEFWGIVCRHILSVFLHEDCFQIPATYLPLRWCRDQCQGNRVVEQIWDNIDVHEEQVVVQCPPASVTKGRPKKGRMKGGKELAKQIKRCSCCNSSGHNVTTCPSKENINVNHAAKRKKYNVTICPQEENINVNHVAKKKKTEARDKTLNPVLSLKI